MRFESYKQIAYFIVKHNNGSITDKEWIQLMEWRKENQRNNLLFLRLSNPEYIAGRQACIKRIDLKKELRKIKKNIHQVISKKKYEQKSNRRFVIAASVLLIVLLCFCK